MEYKPVQKKNLSWTPAKVQKKGKSPGKLGHFSIQPQPHQTSAPSQEIGEYKRASADRLAANVMRGIQAKEQEQAEGSTVQRKSESPWAPGFDAATPITQTPASQLKGAFAPVSENPIQRQCADCAKEEEQQAGEAGKDLEEIGIQTKLTVGAPGDPYEQEADRVASQVISMSAPPDSSASVQRQLETNNPNQIWQRAQSITPVVQRQIDPRVQMRQMLQRAAQIDGNQASGDLESRLNASKGGGSPLSEGVRGFMEPRFGADFSGVRVHTGGEAVQMNQELGAQAFTHGSDVYFGAGKSPGNNELTAHELTHVVQQNGNLQINAKKANVHNYKEEFVGEENLFAQTTTPGGGGNNLCLQILGEILSLLYGGFEQTIDGIQLRGSTPRGGGVRSRWQALHDDPLHLYDNHRSRSQAHPDHGSWEGHIDQYNNRRNALRNRVSNWDRNFCNNDNNLPPSARNVLNTARIWINQVPPDKPTRHHNRFELPEWARQAGVAIRDGVLWIPRTIGVIAIAILKGLANLWGLPWRMV